jgi:hypothetical protein
VSSSCSVIVLLSFAYVLFSVLKTAKVKTREELNQKNSVAIGIRIITPSSNKTKRGPQKIK